MKKTAIILIACTLISKLSGFFRDIVLSHVYGTSDISDAYIISLTIPTAIFALIGTGISTSYIPIYSSINHSAGRKRADLFTSNIINLTISICIIIIVILFIFTEPIVRIFAMGFNSDTFNLAVKLTRISIFGLLFSGVFYILTGFFQIKNSYIIPAFMGIPFNLTIIISILVSTFTSYYVLAFGSVIAVMFQLFFLFPFIKKLGYSHKKIFKLKDNYIMKFISLAIPVILGVSVNQINVIIDKTLASNIAVGGISALNYANNLNLFILGVFSMAIATVMYPIISKMVIEDNITGLKKTVKDSIIGINFLLTPIILGVLIFSGPIVNLLFGHGSFSNESFELTSSALFYYSIGMLGFGLREVLARVFYSMQDTKTPMINMVYGMTLNIILNIILSRYMGISGLALSTSIAAIFTTGLLFISLRKKIGSFEIKNIAITFMKIALASILMGLTTKYLFDYLLYKTSISHNISLVFVIIIGAIIYLIVVNFLRVSEIDVFKLKIREKLLYLNNNIKKR